MVHPVRAFAHEAISEEELQDLLQRAAAGKRPTAYIGFEPSGTAHIGWMVCAEAIHRLLDAGFDVTILLADWHAQINDKLGGDLQAIRRCGQYMQDAFAALGIPPDRVRYRWAAEFAADPDYWALVIQVGKATTLARVRRAMDIMGRSADEADQDMSKFLYPAMQVADIFHMQMDLALGGLDQRHAHMLARDVAKKLGRKAPVALHVPLVPSLKAGGGRMDPLEAKMSKSDPDSGLFLHDAPEVVVKKLRGAHCPAKETAGNPVLDVLRLVVFPGLARAASGAKVPPAFRLHRPEKYGGDKLYMGIEAVEAEFKSGALHPADLKNGVADALNQLLEPVRAYFAAHPDNLEFMKAQKATR